MLKEHHSLPICVFTSPTSDHFRGSGIGNNWALGDFVSATTCSALVAASLLPQALRHHMSYFMESVTPDNPAAVWVVVMKDRHLHCSLSAGWEWDDGPDNSGCLNVTKRRMDSYYTVMTHISK